MIVCVAPNPSIDTLLKVERLSVGHALQAVGAVRTAGGKGLNVARTAHRLGAEVCAAALLRGHAGKWLEEALLADGIGTAVVWADGENRSCWSVADPEDDTLTEFYERGSAVPEEAWLELEGATSRLFEPGRTVTISGSMPRGIAPDGYRRLVSEARTAGMRVALDTAGDSLRLALDAQPEIVKVNAAEAAAVLGAEAGDRDGAAAAAAGLRELAGGAGRFGIVTRGTDGVIVAAADGTMWEGLATERGRYPVGSGDAFLAGFVVGLERGTRWPDPLRLALGAAAANAEVPGAGVLDPASARVLASRASIREI